MSPDEKSDIAILNDLVAACLRITGYVQGVSRSDLDRNRLLLSACCYEIAVIGEAVKRLSPATRSKRPEVPWKEIAGMRDRLIHGYDAVDIDELWKTQRRMCPRYWSELGSSRRRILGRDRFAAREGVHPLSQA